MIKNTQLKKSFDRTIAYYQDQLRNYWELNHEPDNIKEYPLRWEGGGKL